MVATRKTRRNTGRMQPWRAYIILLCLMCGQMAMGAPQRAWIVMDQRDGRVYGADQADVPLHPASMTKMMTLYLAFQAVRRGWLNEETVVAVTDHAAGMGGSRMGLRAGQRVTVGALLRGAALASGNDAAVALAEAVAGSEDRFVTQMNNTARRMGLSGTRFANPHGLTAPGHLSTARDMAVLARYLSHDFPEFYQMFALSGTQMGGQALRNTNRRFLQAYDGAEGIKSGYTGAAGYTLTAAARRDGRRLIVTVMGAENSAQRAAWAAELLDRAFEVAPARVAPRPPGPGGGALIALNQSRPALSPGLGAGIAAEGPPRLGSVLGLGGAEVAQGASTALGGLMP